MNEKKPRWPIASLIVLTGLNMLDYIDRALLGAVLPLVQPALGVDDMAIFSIHLFGDLWSPKIVGYLSLRWGDLQRAVLWCLPGVLIFSALFWGWLLVLTRREQAANPSRIRPPENPVS